MRVMVIGAGAREHALAARIARSRSVEQLLCVPGNGGTAAIGQNVALDPEDIAAVVALARERRVDFVVVGPEGPLVAGVADALRDAGIETFGPGRVAAQLEGSKAFSKRFMQRHGVPTAQAAVFEDAEAAAQYAGAAGRPLVVKADGLAAGKGVIVAGSVEETVAAIDRVMRQRQFGAAGARVVLEERLQGEEVSFHVLLDGARAVAFPIAQDHKRLADGDRGPNTGGMGAYSPPPIATAELERKILERVLAPTLAGLRADGLDYRGVLFIGLMIVGGEPYVLEYNTRFGDPEMQVLLARCGGDLLELLLGAARGRLAATPLELCAPAAMTVVLAAPGYPGTITRGLPIAGLEDAARVPGIEIQHAGTRREADRVLTSGGRVLSVTASGPDLDTVAARIYAAVDRIHFEGMQYRRDIGQRARRLP